MGEGTYPLETYRYESVGVIMLILPTSYLAPVSWYKAYLSEEAQIEVFESFPRSTMRNRCVITGTNGCQTLTVPVCKAQSKQLTRDVQVSYQSNWQHQHWQALVSAYRHTPYFDYFADIFEPLYQVRTRFLVDLNANFNEVVLRLLNKSDLLSYTPTADWQGDTDLDRYFLPSKPQREYYQIFADKQGFTANLSIVDLLFNMGTEAEIYIS